MEHFESMVERVNNVMRDLLNFEYDPDAEISNIVAIKNLGSPIPLEALVLELGTERTGYEPEQFRALMYREVDYVVLLFASGTLLCTGLTDLNTVSEAIEDTTKRIQAVP